MFVEKGISPIEIEEKWTLKLVLDANDALNLQQEAERLAHQASQKE